MAQADRNSTPTSNPGTREVSASTARARSLRPKEPSVVSDGGLPVGPDELGQRFLGDATEQGNFESSKLAEGPIAPELEPEEPLMSPEELEEGNLESSEAYRNPHGMPHPTTQEKGAYLTVSPEAFRRGQRCTCAACEQDGQHDPDCVVHDEPRGSCSCGLIEESKE